MKIVNTIGRHLLLLLALSLFSCSEADEDIVPEVNLSLSVAEMHEAGSVDLVATLSEAVKHTVTLTFAFEGSAELNRHYYVQYSSLTIAAGQESAVLPLSIYPVTNSDPLRLVVSIASVQGALEGSSREVELLIFKLQEEVEGVALSVKANQKYQLIRGFGGISVPDWGNHLSTSEANLAFGVGEGQVGLSLLRLRISPDANRFVDILDLARQAHNMGVTLFASPWSPPAWMKTNNNVVGGSLKAENYGDYAAHLKSFIDYLAGEAIPLYAISIQNEPDIAVDYESCDWTSTEMIAFLSEHVADLGDVKIIAPESFQFRKGISDALLNNDAAAARLDIVGGHIYGGGLEPYPLALEKGKELWMTEHYVNEEGAITEWKEALKTAKEIHDCMLADMSAYVYWYIRRYYGLIDENGQVSKKGYAVSNFARFVRPGARRVEVPDNPAPGIHVSAYEQEGQVVVVVLNENDKAVQLDLKFADREVQRLETYLTSAQVDCLDMAQHSPVAGVFALELAPSSVNTYVSID